MLTEKRKAQLRESQKKSREKKKLEGWRWVLVPPPLLEMLKQKIKKYKN